MMRAIAIHDGFQALAFNQERNDDHGIDGAVCQVG